MRKKIINDDRLILRVCNMFYNQGIPQSSIAKTLGVSRPTVAKLLESGKDKGIVTITITDPSGRKYYELEQELEDKFGLKEVFITESYSERAKTREAIGKAGADLLKRFIKDNSIVGVSLGTTVSQIIPYIEEEFKPNTTFIPLVGGFSNMPQDIQGNTLAEKLAEKYSGDSLAFYTPIRITNENLLKELREEKSVCNVFRKAKKMDIALMGIGGNDDKATIIQSGYMSANRYDELVNSGVVGDVCVQFYDRDGKIEPYSINKELLTIDLNVLKKVQHAIGMTFGLHKIDAILGAINGEFINILVTDLETAKALGEVDLDGESSSKMKAEELAATEEENISDSEPE